MKYVFRTTACHYGTDGWLTLVTLTFPILRISSWQRLPCLAPLQLSAFMLFPGIVSTLVRNDHNEPKNKVLRSFQIIREQFNESIL